MSDINKDVVVVFQDAADYDASIIRNGAFRNLPKDPYVVICRDTYGGVDASNLAPSEIRAKILDKNPESYSTWMCVHDDWVCVCDNRESTMELFDKVFRSDFFDKVDSLMLIVQALGFRKITMAATETREDGKRFENSVSGNAESNIPFGRFKAQGSYDSTRKNSLKLELEKRIHKEFRKHEDFDREKVTALMRRYGFEGDKQLIALRDELLYRQEPCKNFSYSFQGEFFGDTESRVEAAAKIAAGVKICGKKVAGEIGAEIKRQAQEMKKFVQSLTVVLEN